VKPPGFFQRLFGGFKINLTVNPKSGTAMEPGVHFRTTVQQTIKVRDPATGEFKEYHSLDEVPAEYREKFKQATALGTVTDSKQVTFTGGHVKRSEQITFVGPDGVRHTYQSMDEVPESVRKLIEDAKRAPGSK
jgi:hypothetical protein